jgi:cyclophilin family peptidyl-prolyl cis-trans isomerase
MNHCIVSGRGVLVVLAVAWAAQFAAAQTAEQAAPVAGQAVAAAGPGGEITAAEAKAQFDQRFAAYGNSLREIEKLRTDYQTAGASGRKTIDFQLQEKLAAAKQQLEAMVAAGLECYRLAPQENPQLGQLLVSVAKHYVAGDASRQEPKATNGGDSFEKSLPIIQTLIDSGSEDKRLPLWGYLAAFATNDYDLAEAYLKKAQANGVLSDPASLTDESDQSVLGLVMNYAPSIDKYRELWTKEQAIRAAEAQADDLPRVKFKTSKGDIVIELFENEAPQATANMLTLVKSGFYNGVSFHRVLPHFMAQGGDPKGDGSGGPGYSIRCESYQPNARHHFRGSLSMAHAGRDTGGSQFFLTFMQTPHLDGKHTVFGRVIEGMDVLGELQKRNPQEKNQPAPDKIITAEVLRDRGHEYKFDKLPGR